MNLRTVLLLLISALLLTGYTPSQDKSQTNPRIEPLLKQLANTDESPEKVLILKDLCWEYRRVDGEKAWVRLQQPRKRIKSIGILSQKFGNQGKNRGSKRHDERLQQYRAYLFPAG